MKNLAAKIVRTVRRKELSHSLKRKATRFKETRAPFKWLAKPPRQGVNLAAYIRAEMGLGQAARGIAAALEAAQIPFNILNFESGNPARHADMSWQGKERPRSDYDITILAINPDHIFDARYRLPEKIFIDRYLIGSWFWELPEIPDSWLPAFSLVNEVWAASNFVLDAFSKKSPVPIIRIPPVVKLNHTGHFDRRHFELQEGRFLFLTVCDATSVIERKNPMGVVQAFKKAFAANDQTVGLVIKVSGPDQLRRRWEPLREQIQGYQNIRMIERILTREEIGSLLLVSDCLVSLHRSEGFGLVPAEAMSLAKPIIATRWSGNVDYMTPDNSIGVDYQLVKVAQDCGLYEAHQYWAEPDLDQAAYWMRRLVEEPHLGKNIGERGQQTIKDSFSPEVVGRAITQRLTGIRASRPSGTS